MTETASLVIKVDSSGAAKATRNLDVLGKQAIETERATSRLGAGIGAALGGAAVAATAVATAALGKYIRNTIEAEKAQAQLAAVLKSTGQAAGLSQRELNNYADALQAVTTFDDESITGAQSLLLTFTKIGREVFPAATEAVLDMSTAMGQGLKESAIQLGKALNDPIQGVSALTRVGVQFTDAQKDQIEAMVESGRVAQAQRIILKELETQMGGSARAARDTLGGALTALKNSFDNLLEGDVEDGGLRGTRKAVEDFNTTLNDPGIKAGVDNVASGLLTIGNAAVTATAKIGELIGRYKDWLANQGLAPTDANSSPEQLAARRERLQGMVDRMETGRTIWGDDTANKLRQQIRQIDSQTGAATVPDYLKVPELQGRQPFSAVPSMIDYSSFKSTKPTPTATGGDSGKEKKGLTDAQKAAQALQAAYDSLNESQREEIALFGQTTEAAKIRYATEQGALAALDPVKKAQLIASAEQLDALADLAEIEEVWAEAASDSILKEGERTQAIHDGQEATAKLIEEMEFEASLIGLNNIEREKQIALRYADAHATEEQIARIGELAVATEKAREQQQFADETQRGLSDAVVDYASKTKSATEAFGDFADQLFKRALQFVADKAIQAMFGAMGGVGGSGGGWGALVGGAMSAFGGGWGGIAKGGAFGGGQKIERFALGGVFNSPQMFQHGGKMGVLGEAGPEAIMPLKRGRDGKLGIAGAGGGPSTVVQNFTQVVQGKMTRRTSEQAARANGREAARGMARTGR